MMADNTDWQGREDKASLLIGRVIRNWSRLDQWVWGQVASFQMIARARYSRLPRAFYPDIPPDAEIRPFWEVGNFHPPAGSEPGTRFRHLERLAKVLIKDQKILMQIDAKLQELRGLYNFRNDLAHAEVSVLPPWEGDGVRLSSRAWADKAEQKLKEEWKAAEKDPRQSNKSKQRSKLVENWELFCGRKSYTFEQIEAAARRLDDLWWELRDIADNVPIEGEAMLPVEPPKRR